MMMRIKHIFLLFLLLCCTAGAQAEDYDFFEPFHDDREEMFDAAYPQMKTDYSVLHNLFFQNERWRIYNHTAYQTNQFNHKMLTGDTSSLSFDDFSISVGYGVAYQLNFRHRIGYEYLSSFPFDRGQMIRFFWLSIF